MSLNKMVLAVLVALLLSGVGLYAQVQSEEDIVAPTPQFQDHGGVTPWFWIGIQTVFGAGYNFETGAGGFRNYGGDHQTWATFNLAFVDSHYSNNKFYEVPKELDPEAWTAHFYLLNFTTRDNSWEESSTYWEQNVPAWLAEITGKGTRTGFFTQAGNLIGGLGDTSSNSGDSLKDNKPVMRIYGGNKVLNLGKGQLGKVYYENEVSRRSPTNLNTTTLYDTTNGAIMYVGYEKPELFNVFLTMLSEGNVNTAVGKDPTTGKETGKGFAGVIDFGVTPFGVYADDQTPLTFDVSGNLITGFNFNSGANSYENVGFGLKAGSGIWLQDNMILSPMVAFDGKLDTESNFFWKFGGGVVFQFSGMRWASDEWGDLFNTGLPGGSTSTRPLADYRYENNKILKFAYGQVYAAYSDDQDLNMVFRVEEPDGNLGFHEQLGAMLEMRLYNMTENTKTTAGVVNESSWEMQGRVSWDFNIKQYLVTPYLRAYMNSDDVFKLRFGAYANIIPFTGFELCYTSANLNPDVKLSKPSYLNSSYDKFFDAGRIELLVILKSDDMRPVVPKRMSDWNYPTTIQHF